LRDLGDALRAALAAALDVEYESVVYWQLSNVPTVARMFLLAAVVAGVVGGGFQGMQLYEANRASVDWG
jgi:hypothetical protein